MTENITTTKANKAPQAVVPSEPKKSLTKKSPAKQSSAEQTPAAVSKQRAKAAQSSDGKLRKGKFKKVSKDDAREIMRLLCERYPDADCELNFENDFQLLTAVILSAQTTDATVNKATPALFKRFPTAKGLSEANLDDVKELVKSTGYYNAKAKNIQSCAQALVKKFAGKVPTKIEELVTLPGVGRKTANVVLGVIHNVPGWTVDTHVQRLSNRLGFTNEADPTKIEFALQKLFPAEPWHQYSITLIWHGRRLCYARNPDCPACPVKHLCPSAQI
jgi:endonuclease-3